MSSLDPAQLVGLGGAGGAVLRYAVGRTLASREFPLATLTVNAIGTLVLGLVAFGGAGGGVLLAIGTGACGSFTTFSSFSFETVQLWEAGERLPAAVNAVANLAAAGLALGVARWLVG